MGNIVDNFRDFLMYLLFYVFLKSEIWKDNSIWRWTIKIYEEIDILKV